MPADEDTTIAGVRERIAAFVRAREWDSFHNAKDLASAIAIEAAELMEVFLWTDAQEIDEQSRQPSTRQRIEEELADIFILSLSLANHLDIDVADAVTGKLAVNETKYPADVVRGKAHKYTYYDRDK